MEEMRKLPDPQKSNSVCKCDGIGRFENHLTFGQSECVVTINAYYALKPCTKKVTECCFQSTTLNVISDLQTTGFFNICVRK